VLVELIRTTTADGIRLDGLLRRAASRPALPAPSDCVLMLHGTGGAFYTSALLHDLAEWFLQRGVSVAVVNTRGHDLVYAAHTSSGLRYLGAAFESLGDALLDVAAWVDTLQAHGFADLGLLGHSGGAVKGIVSVATAEQRLGRRLAVGWLCAVSPPRLSYDYFARSSAAGQFEHALQTARQHIEQRQPETLIRVGFPLPMIIAAASYLEKYGPGEQYNIVRYLDRLTVPTLVTYGQLEVRTQVAFRDMPRDVAQAAPPGVEVATIDGADHQYAGVRRALWDCVAQWLDSLPPDAQRRPGDTARPAGTATP
jgi:hypothetical protein